MPAKNNIVIIGYGKLGSHLFYALKKKGSVPVVIKSPKNKITASLIKKADIIFIAVQDSKIKSAANSLKIFDLKNKYIYHTSGSLTSDELQELVKKGAVTGSFHPVQTFESMAKKDEERFNDIYTALEGSSKSIKKAAEISKLLGSKTVILTKRNKVYHHMCCVIASNFMAALMHHIEVIGSKKIRKNGFNNLSFFNIYKPLAEQTLDNIAKKGAVKSLTGPIERNDIYTVTKHLESTDNELLPVYVLMGIETVKLSLKKKSLTAKEAEEILDTFDKFMKINNIF
jgi:predicted short-subunit dehydrogenase-like oxidoreductase (DUF2520 family)